MTPRPAAARPPGSGRLDRVARAVLLALGLAFAVTLVAGSGSTTVGGRVGGDYPAFYGAGRIVASGHGDDLYNPTRQAAAERDLFGREPDGGYLYFAYPPAVAALYAPLSSLDYRWSYALHTLLMVAAVVVALWLLRPMVGIVDRHFTVVLAASLCFYPLFRAVSAGQNTALSLLLVAASWRAVHEDRQFAAGIALGLLCFKPQLAGLFIVLHLLSRRWRVGVGAAVGFGAIWFASAAVMGPEWLTTWWHQAQHFAAVDAVVNRRNAISWVGVGHALFGPGTAASVAGYGLSALTVVVVAWTWRHAPRTGLAPAIGAAATGVVLASPHTMFYDAGLLVVAAVVLADRLGRPGQRAIAVAWLLSIGHVFAETIGWSPIFLVSVIAFAVAVTEARRPPVGRPVEAAADGRRDGDPGIDLSIVVPAFNEAERIGPTLESIATELRHRSGSYEVIVVDDGSSDATVAVVESYRELLPGLKIVSLPSNRGKGAAVRIGMLEARGARRLFMDADNSTDLSQLDRLDAASRGPVVIASVAADGASVTRAQPAGRSLAGRVGNLIIRLAVLPGVGDSQRGFKVFSAQAAVDIFGRCVIDGWGFDVEALGLARVLGHQVTEVGVSWAHVEASRVRPGAYLETLVEVVRIQSRLLRVAQAEALAVEVADRPQLVEA